MVRNQKVLERRALGMESDWEHGQPSRRSDRKHMQRSSHNRDTDIVLPALTICQFRRDTHERSGPAAFLVLFGHEQRLGYAPAY